MTDLKNISSINNVPHLRKQGSATQLIVDGKPFLIIGGELHNSSTSNIKYMGPIWQRMTSLNLNTVLAPVSWELIEPKEGVFDFTLVDSLIQDARRYDLRLILLWFGSWKNGMSSYVPLWVKQDYDRFPRVRRKDGKATEILSPFSEANWQADATAFARLMQHIREVDGNDHSVIMLRVENEVGVLADARDHSEEANRSFAGSVPQELINHLVKYRQELDAGVQQRWESNGSRTSGSWEEVFGSGLETDEIYMAWNYAIYIDKVAAAGKVQYTIPMFVNAWLTGTDQSPGGWPSGGKKPGDWPSGGPLPHTLDIWLAGAPHLDLLCPDIYFGNFQEWCKGYTRRGNPLFIPEMRHNEGGPRNVFYAIGQHDAIGTSPFAVDSIENPAAAPISTSYAVLRQLAPLILEHQGKGSMVGFILDEENSSMVCDRDQTKPWEGI